MLHRTVAYDVREIEPGRWRWNILQGNRQVPGWTNYPSRERAVAACHAEIDDGIERTRRAGPLGISK